MTYVHEPRRVISDVFTLQQLVDRYKARVEVLEAELDVYRERDRQRAESVDFSSAAYFCLTKREWLIMDHLLRVKTASKEALMSVLYAGAHEDAVPEIKIIDVFVCKLRKKLKRHSIFIGTTWGHGYFMTQENKDRVASLAAGIR